MKYKHPTAFSRFNRITAAVVLAAAIFAVPVFAEGTFTDVPSEYWGAPYIQAAAESGIIDGYAVGSSGEFIFKPENLVSKQESATMIYRTLAKAGLLKEDADLSLDYAQILKACSIADWAGRYAAYGFKYAYLEQADFAASTKTLKGGAVNAPRQTIAAWCAKAMGYELSAVSMLPYGDALKVSPAMIPYVDALYRAGIMTGDTKGNLNPLDGIKRVEFAAICTRLLDSARENAGTAQSARKLAGSLIIASGKVTDINLTDRTLLITDSEGRTSRLQIASDALIMLDGAEAAFADLSTLWNKYSSVSCIMGAGRQVLVQTKALVQTGIIDSISSEDDYAVLTIKMAGGARIKYCYDDQTIMESTVKENGEITFIADGAYLLEIK
jgi:hypothetical protein